MRSSPPPATLSPISPTPIISKKAKYLKATERRPGEIPGQPSLTVKSAQPHQRVSPAGGLVGAPCGGSQRWPLPQSNDAFSTPDPKAPPNTLITSKVASTHRHLPSRTWTPFVWYCCFCHFYSLHLNCFKYVSVHTGTKHLVMVFIVHASLPFRMWVFVLPGWAALCEQGLQVIFH